MEIEKNNLISLDMLGMLIDDLNNELTYKISEHFPTKEKFLFLNSDGCDHSVHFLGDVIWHSAWEKNYEDIPIVKNLELNERSNFEKYLRLLISDRLSLFNNSIEM